jgi:hypothetical protein
MRRSGEPRLEDWELEGAMDALTRLLADLLTIDADEAWRRLDRLTHQQRTWVLDKVDEWDPGNSPTNRRES